MTRRAVQAELVAVAQELFARDGYEATTTEAIAAAAGMSRRSFFRYFASKEDLVLGKYELLGDRLVEALRTRPDDEPLWDALSAVFAGTTSDAEVHPIEQVIDQAPSLRGSYLQRLERIQFALVEEARLRAARAGSPIDDDDPTPQAVIGAVFACMTAARASAVRSDRPWPVLVQQALCAVRQGGAGAPATRRRRRTSS